MRIDQKFAIASPAAREDDAASRSAAHRSVIDTPAAQTCLREVSIVVPTINEAGNLPDLIERIDVAMAGIDYEVLVIDDGSQDGTVEICRELGRTYPVILYVRPEPIDGLSGAVLHGFAAAQGRILVVMDADLQHPPEALPALIAPLISRCSDFVIGSRRIPGSTIAGSWGLPRRLNSMIARWLAAPLVGGIHDPLSGFFAIWRATWEQAEALNPLGYKIALELLCKCPIRKVTEIPIEFGTRGHGSSKLTALQRTRYLRHLIRLYSGYCKLGRTRRDHVRTTTSSEDGAHNARRPISPTQYVA